MVDGTLRLGTGVYQTLNPILVKSNSAILGTTWDTVIVGTNGFTVIAAYNFWHDHASIDSSITLKNFKVQDLEPSFNSAYQTISLGNCHNCLADSLWLDRTQTIGIQLGGASEAQGQINYALNSKVTNCLFSHVASQNVAVVNGENIEVSGNRFLAPGQIGGPGNTSFDGEINNDNDRLVDIRVIGNTFDHRGAEAGTTGNAIQVTSGSLPHAATRHVGKILISDNVIIGGTVDPPSNAMSNGILVTGSYMNDAKVLRNKITRTGQTGLWIDGMGITVEDNELDSVGGGGTEGFRLTAGNSQIRRNSIKCSGPCSREMVVTGTGNTIENNEGFSMIQSRRPKRK